MDFLVFAMLIPITAVVGGLIIAGLGIHHRARLKELAYRERIAMIERGLTPPPETDPGRFDEFIEARREESGETGRSRHQTAGVVLIGVGLALMLLISVAGQAPDAGIGVGGAVTILGIAFLVNSLLNRGGRLPAESSSGSPPSTPSSRPPESPPS